LRYAQDQNHGRVLEVTTLRAQVDASIAGERLVTTVSTVFGLLALVLAAVGLYGVISYSVTRRTNEIGIRMALGASPSEVLRLVLRETLLLITIGIAIGVPAALAGKRLIESQLYGVDPADPLAFTGAAVVLLVVALAAAYIPARRASRVDPMVALHYE
jgi:ABC-type antimicrobial peptide transport system permease subunit